MCALRLRLLLTVQVVHTHLRVEETVLREVWLKRALFAEYELLRVPVHGVEPLLLLLSQLLMLGLKRREMRLLAGKVIRQKVASPMARHLKREAESSP